MTQTYLTSQLLKRLHEIGKDADSRTAEIEDLRRLPDDIAQSLKDSGVLRLWTAKEYGGHEAHINAMLDATETLSYYDGSTGWVAMVTGTASLTSGFMQPEAGQRIFGDAGSMVGGLVAPMGMAQQVDGGLRVSGKWFWGSGTPFCTTIIGLARVVDAESKPSKLDNGVKLPLLFFKPEDVTLHDTWHVSGLKGTASGEYTVQDVFVPDGDWVAFPPVTPVLDRTLYRFPYTGALAAGVASAALGMARRALDEILVLGPNKTPQWTRDKLSERPVVQTQIAQAEANYRAARAFLRETVAQVWEEVEAGEASLESRRLLRMAATHATEQAAKTVDTAYHLGAGSSIWSSVPLQRLFRDVHVATQHAIVSPNLYELFGRMALDLPTNTAML